MTEAVFKYDEVGDTLYISFVPGIALNDQLLLRIDKQTRQAVGVTIDACHSVSTDAVYSLLPQGTSRQHPLLLGLIKKFEFLSLR